MKKSLLLLTSILLSSTAGAADLLQVFQDALAHDTQYQQAVFKSLSSKEDVRISRSSLLPGVQAIAQPLIDAQNNSGAITQELLPYSNTYRSIDMRLNIIQPVFNYGLFKRLAASKLSARESAARLNAEQQDLMFRVVDAYLKVLRDENQLAYLRAHKKALARQFYDVKQKNIAGKTTKTYVYMAKSAYSAAESDYISAEAQLVSSKERLTTITAVEYPHLAKLRKKIAFISPKPLSVRRWVETALRQNWTVKADQLRLQAAREKIKEHFADHLPVVNAQAYVDKQIFHETHGSLLIAPGTSRELNSVAFLNVKIPIYSGGLVTAKTTKARYRYQILAQKLDMSLRKTASTVRRSYVRILANMKKIRHGEIAIQSASSSLNGLRERYHVGSGNLADVLNEQDKLVDAQMKYDAARYDYIIELLRLKKAAGTLAASDLQILNSWFD